MQRIALLISGDEKLQATRDLILRKAGYVTVCTSNLVDALDIAGRRQPDLVILGHSFAPSEQMSFIEHLHELDSRVGILCLRFGLIHPPTLLRECDAFFTGQGGCPRVKIAEGDGVTALPDSSLSRSPSSERRSLSSHCT